MRKHNEKLERMLEKLGGRADNSDFRDLLQSERKSATQRTKALMERIKEERTKGEALETFEREYVRFTTVVNKIDLKQKQQMVKFSNSQAGGGNSGAGGVADEIREEERQSGRHGSYDQAQLPSDADITFLEYNVDEIQVRHDQIKAIERDIREVAEMWKDLQMMVNEDDVKIKIIGDHIDGALKKTQQGEAELRLAEEHQLKARKKACCVLVIILAFVLIAILVLLGTTGKL